MIVQPNAAKRNPPQLDAAIRLLSEQVARGAAERLAVALDVNPATIGRWASGQITPSGSKRARLLAWAEGEASAPASARDGYSAGLLEAARRMSLTVASIIAAAQGAEAAGAADVTNAEAATTLAAEVTPAAGSVPPSGARRARSRG